MQRWKQRDNFKFDYKKSQFNNTISVLAIGDKVRKNVLFQDEHSKGADPRWSDEVYTVKAIYGNSILLNS